MLKEIAAESKKLLELLGDIPGAQMRPPYRDDEFLEHFLPASDVECDVPAD